jgi:hypothetical protein
VLDYLKFRPVEGANEQKNAYYQLSGHSGVEYIPCNSEGDDSLFIKQITISDMATVFLDITSISIPDIFCICFVLKEIKNIERMNVVYAEPKYYSYLNGIYFEYAHHVGERDYRPLNEYFTSAASREVILVCFLGFDRLISKYIHERKEHSSVIAINGFPAYYPKLKDISLEHNFELISTIGTECVQYTQANDPYYAYNALSRIKAENDGKILDICVLGSKPMALGACMFSLDNPDYTKVSYPFPTKYRLQTTIETAEIWWYEFCLRNLQ